MITINKPTLLSERPLTLNSMWLSDIIDAHLTLEYYDAAKTYNKQSTVFYAPYRAPATPIQQQFLDDGFRIVYDNLWEAPVVDPSKYIIQHWDWIRYYESTWYTSLGYNTYQPNQNYKHLALMPMRLKKPHRDLAIQQLRPWLDDFVWSYVEQGRQLPNDSNLAEWGAQRYFNPEWYNDTCFSFVSESFISLIDNQVLVSEKTYKPIAFYHPFVILGPVGILQSLRNLGFETFENLFDEQYDTESNWIKRLNCLVDNVKQFQKQPYDKLTKEKIAHNHDRFFNVQLTTTHIEKEIVHPLLHYIET